MKKNFTEKDVWMAYNTLKDVLLHQPFGKGKLKPQGDIITYLTEWLKQKGAAILNAGEDVEKLGPSFIIDRNAKWYSHSEK